MTYRIAVLDAECVASIPYDMPMNFFPSWLDEPYEPSTTVTDLVLAKRRRVVAREEILIREREIAALNAEIEALNVVIAKGDSR